MTSDERNNAREDARRAVAEAAKPLRRARKQFSRAGNTICEAKVIEALEALEDALKYSAPPPF